MVSIIVKLVRLNPRPEKEEFTKRLEWRPFLVTGIIGQISWIRWIFLNSCK